MPAAGAGADLPAFAAAGGVAAGRAEDRLTFDLQREIAERLNLVDAQKFVSSFDRPNLRYRVVHKDNGNRQLLDFLAAHRLELPFGFALD